MTEQSAANIFVVGGANLDISGSCFQRLKPGDSNPGTVKNSAGGVGRNIAENLSRLGINATLISAVGHDLGKEVILKSCSDSGINATQLIFHPTLSTGTYLAINNQLGALLAAIADMSIIDSLTVDILRAKEQQLKNADEIVIEANLPEESIQWLCAEFSGKTIHADAVSSAKANKLETVLEHLHILKVNRDEASQILKAKDTDIGLAKRLFDKGVKQVLLSQGAEGCTLYSAEGQARKTAIRGDNQNDTGSGDALLSGFIAARHLLRKPIHQLEFAVACATFTLNSTSSVNPALTVDTIKTQFLSHIDESDWLS